MILNVDKFKEILRKATVNFSIDNVQFLIEKDSVKSKMVSSIKDVVAILNLPNDFLSDCKGEVTFNFSEPQTQLLPYLNLIDAEEAHVKVTDVKLRLEDDAQKADVFFCSPHVLSLFAPDRPKVDDYFTTLDADDTFKAYYNKIKKIAVKFGKVYFTVKDNVFSIETMDKANKFSNALSIVLSESVEVPDRTLGFDFKNLSNLMSIIEPANDFKIKFAYVPSQEMGMLYCYNRNESERYYLMSTK